jgi:large subunit ribosomal protein L16
VLGAFGLRALGYSKLTTKQIESARMSALRPIKGACTMRTRIKPDVVITKRPADTRMGSGKGAPDHEIFRVRPGRQIFEVSGISEERAREALALAAAKLPVATVFVKSNGWLVNNR